MRLRLNACMLEESLFVSIANIRKKNLLRLNKLSSTVWSPDISLFPESLQKTWGRGWSRRYLRYFTTVLRYTKRRSARFGFCSVGGTGGTTSRCQLHVVEPRAQQGTSTGKLWRRWLHYITCTTLVLAACLRILNLSKLIVLLNIINIPHFTYGSVTVVGHFSGVKPGRHNNSLKILCHFPYWHFVLKHNNSRLCD